MMARKRAIDVDKLIAELKWCKAQSVTADWWDDIIERVKKQPIIQLRVVRHGRWILNNKETFTYHCSICNVWNNNNLDDFCRNCGAKMDGKDLA